MGIVEKGKQYITVVLDTQNMQFILDALYTMNETARILDSLFTESPERGEVQIAINNIETLSDNVKQVLLAELSQKGRE